MKVAVLVLARVVSVLCLGLLAVGVVFDAQVERVTSGTVPAEFGQRLQAPLAQPIEGVLGVGHNVGDDLKTETDAVAYSVGAVEIDVRSIGGELFASHDQPLAFLEDLAFHGPTLAAAWRVASLRPAVLLHLKEHSQRFVDQVAGFLARRPRRRLVVQTSRASTLARVKRRVPYAERLLLVFNARELAAIRADPRLAGDAQGLSVRDELVTPDLQRWMRRRGLRLFVWTVNDEGRLEELVRGGVDGVVTERLDLMRALSRGRERA